MYKINKVINNNVTIVQDSKLREYIVIGKALGFKKKPGDIVNDNQIEKKYKLNNEKQSGVLNILEEADLRILNVVDKVKEMIELEYKVEYTNFMYFSLVDHINNALKRKKLNAELAPGITVEDLNLYKTELDIATKVYDLINDELNIELFDDEIIYITLHLITFVYEASYVQLNDQVLKITNEIIEIVQYNNMTQLDSQVTLKRFIVHLKFFILRNMQKQSKFNDDNEHLYEYLKQQSPNAVVTLNKICSYLNSTYGFNVSDNEKVYLLIHLSKIIK